MCIFINGRLYHSDRHDLPSLNPVPKEWHITTTDKNQPLSLKAPTSLNAGGGHDSLIKKSNIYIASDYAVFKKITSTSHFS